MENQELNEKIIDIWKNNFDEITKIYGDFCKWPVLSPDFNKNSLLFLGINPSGESDEQFKIEDKISLKDEEKIKKFIDMERRNIWKNGYSKYFKPFQTISNQIKINFDHFDLYFFRKRSSKKFLEIIKENKQSNFFNDQLNLSFSVIMKSINPQVIFVANKDASDIFIKHFKNEIIFNELEGFYVLNTDKKIPVFFSGMISSARSIDEYTRDRIVWHIKKALNWYKENNKIK